MNSTSMEEWFKHVKPHRKPHPCNNLSSAQVLRIMKYHFWNDIRWNFGLELFVSVTMRWCEGWCLANSRLRHTSDPSISAWNWNIHVGETTQATRVLWILIVTSCCISLVHKKHKKGSERMSASSHINSSKIVVDGTNDRKRAYECMNELKQIREKLSSLKESGGGAEVNAKMNRWASECHWMEENNKNLWSWLEMRIAYRIFIN